jgi:hypothetical protein
MLKKDTKSQICYKKGIDTKTFHVVYVIFYEFKSICEYYMKEFIILSLLYQN